MLLQTFYLHFDFQLKFRFIYFTTNIVNRFKKSNNQKMKPTFDLKAINNNKQLLMFFYKSIYLNEEKINQNDTMKYLSKRKNKLQHWNKISFSSLSTFFSIVFVIIKYISYLVWFVYTCDNVDSSKMLHFFANCIDILYYHKFIQYQMRKKTTNIQKIEKKNWCLVFRSS